MEIRKEKKFDSEINAPAISPGSYSSITVYNQDSLGTLIIGFLAVILLFRLVRFEKLSDFSKKNSTFDQVKVCPFNQVDISTNC